MKHRYLFPLLIQPNLLTYHCWRCKLPLDETGKGIYKVRASSIGAKKWGGIIALKAPDGSIKNYPFEASYVVGEPNVIVSPTAMNVMYYGINNPIDVSVPGISPDKFKYKGSEWNFLNRES